MRRRRLVARVDGLEVPPVLLDPYAPLWHDRAAFIAFMAVQGWASLLPPQERAGCSSSSRNRRTHAAAAWAKGNGYADPFPRWHELRALGLID